MTTTNELGTIAAQTAMSAAAEYLRVNNLKADAAALASCLRANVKLAFWSAIADAKEAFDCGMTQVGESTFLASMKLAGISAAKECCHPKS